MRVPADKFVDLFKTAKLAQGVSVNVNRRDMRCQCAAAVLLGKGGMGVSWAAAADGAPSETPRHIHGIMYG